MKKSRIIVTLTFVGLTFLQTDAIELSNDVNDYSSRSLLESHGNKEFVQSEKYESDDGSHPLDMIKRAGYPAEAHSVTTADGYILTMHRIPGKSGSEPVLLHHGLFGSSADWMVLGRDKSLACLLADQGYDVWLGNARGNTFSRAHTTLSTSDSKFWDFSFHEMGLEDLPAIINYITDYKSDTLIYIGYSLSTTMFYVMASNRREIGKKVRAMISLGPVAYMSHVKIPVRFIAPFSRITTLLSHFFGVDELLPHSGLVRFLGHYICGLNAFQAKICMSFIFAGLGFDDAQFNYTLMPTILSNAPAGSSAKTFVHYGQAVQSGRFRAYDYGSHKNQKYYNSSTPPDYDLSKIRVPIAFFTGDNDLFVPAEDVNYLWEQLPMKIEKYRINYPNFNHFDFIYATDAPKLVYNEVLSILEKYRDDKTKETSQP